MKRTLALLIAVLLVVGMLPMTAFAAAGQELSGSQNNGTEQTTPAPDANAPGQSQAPAPTAKDYFAVYDSEGNWVAYFADLAAAEAALADGYTLKVLQNYTTDASYAFGKALISYTIDGALANGGNAVITANVAGAAWSFDAAQGAKVTVKNLTMIASESAISAGVAMNLTLENCKVYAGNSYYEVDASAYATAPAANAGVALTASAATVQILGEQTVLRATGGEAVVLKNAMAYVENGYFYSSAAKNTVTATASDLYVNNAVVVNNSAAAIAVDSSSVMIHGGQFVQTGATTADGVTASALCAQGTAKVYVTNATIVAGNAAVGIYATGSAVINVIGATVSATAAALAMQGATVYAGSAATNKTEAATVAIVGEGTAEQPDHEIETTYQATVAMTADAGKNAVAEVQNAKGETVYYLTAADIANAACFVPGNGTLVLYSDLELKSTLAWPMMPEMNITVTGKTAVKIVGAVDGYLVNAVTCASVTLVNVSVENTAGKGIYVGCDDNNALLVKSSVWTLGEGASVTAAKGEALYVATGATVVVLKGATVTSTAVPSTNSDNADAMILVEGGAAFELNGGSVVAPKAVGITLFMTVTANRTATLNNATYNLIAGSVTLPSGVASLHQTSNSGNRPAMTVKPEVVLTAVNPDGSADPFLFNTIENPIELLDDKGEHVAYYDSITAALADVQDGYTIEVLADHLETGYFQANFTEITWTLNGNGHKIFMPENNFYGMEFLGKNVTAYLNDFTLYAAGYGIFLNPETTASGVSVVANNVFVYAAGAANSNGDTYIGNPVRTAAYRIANRGAELVLLGEGSGAYVNGAGNTFTYLIYNGGYLTINGGYYTGSGIDFMIEGYGSAARGNTVDYSYTSIAGGTFVGAEGARFGIRAYRGMLLTITGGNFVTKSGVTLRIGEGDGATGHAMIFGGNFYHLSSSGFVGQSGSSLAYTSVLYYGGTIYTAGTTTTSKLQLQDVDSNWSTGYHSYSYGINIGTGFVNSISAYTTTEAETAYGIAAGTALTAEAIVESDAWLDSLGYTKGDYTFKVYNGVNDEFFGVYALDFTLASYAVGTYNGRIELQKDIDVLHTAITHSRVMGPAAQVTITSVPGECFEYTSSNYGDASTGSNGSTYFLWLTGGTWTVSNVSIINRGSQCIQFNAAYNGQNLSRASIIVADGGEIAGFTSSLLLMNNTKCVVEQGGRITAAKNGVTGLIYTALNLLRVSGSADAEIYGDLGFYRDGSLPTQGGYQCINYNGDQTYVQNTGETCNIYIAPSARLGGAKGAANPLIQVKLTDCSVMNDIFVTSAPGAQYYTDGALVLASAGTQVNVDAPVVKNVTPHADAEGDYFQGNGYLFTFNAAGGVISNMTHRGGAFMLVDSMGAAKNDKLTIKFEGDNHISAITNTLLLVINASCNTDIIFEDGYYHNEVNGNLIYAQPDPIGKADSEGVMTINGGYFFKDNGAGMFKMMGSYDVVVNGGTFHTTASSIFSFTYASGTTHNPASGALTINDGEFIHCAGYLYQNDNQTDIATLTINGGHFSSGSGINYAGTKVQASAVLLVRGNSTATINGGYFETEEYDAIKHCIVLWTQHTAKVTINDWTVHYRSGEESAIRVDGNSTVEVYGGWIESNGRYVARTMGGKNTTTAITTVSEATLKVYGGVMMLTNAHPKLSNSSGYCVVANGGSEQYGHVYIYGGLFVNNRDAEPYTPDSAYARYVMYRSNAFGAFHIYGGILMATPTQDLFYKTSYKDGADGASIPSVDLPIVKGVTPKYEFNGREYYYTVYGVGDSLLVPELQTKVEVDITEEGNGLVFQSAMSPIHYDALLTWASERSFAYNAIADGYKLSFGTLITPVDSLTKTMGIFDVKMFEAYGLEYLDIAASEEDAQPNEDGSLDIFATVENITVENNEVLYMAVPYVVLTVGVGTEYESTVRYYGEYNVVAGVASMANVAAAALRDNTDVAVGEYRYPSIYVTNAFSRYTAEQQAVLLTYLAHEHTFDNQGVCTECETDVAVEITSDSTTMVFAENGLVKFFEVELSQDVSYSIDFNRDTVKYTVYDAEGNIIAVKGGVFTATADGTYYIRVDGKRAGATEMSIAHIHDAGYTGSCGVCGEELSIAITVDKTFEQLVVKNNLYFYTIELEQGISYAVTTANGNYKIYDAQGVEQTVTESVFTCPANGTYYIVVEATFTSTGSVRVQHIHNFDHTGLCTLDYCDEYVGVTISNVYKYTAEKKVVSGDFLFYHIRMEEGKTYAISSLGFIGMFYLYNAQGELLTLGAGDTYTCESAGIYYLVIEVQMTVNAQVRFEVAHGQCQYNNKGQCEFEHARFNLDANGNTVMETVSCGKTDPDRTRVYDNQVMSGTVVPGKKTFVYMNYAAKGVTYLIDLPTTVDYYLYDENGNLIVDGENGVTYTKATNEDGTRTQDTYVDVDSQRILYMVITTKTDATESVVVSGKISHVHNINYRGVCTVKDTTQSTALDCTVNLRTALTADSEIIAVYAAGTMGYYELNLTAGTEYTMNLDSAYVVWTLMNAEGTVVANSEGGDLFIPTEGGDYYLVVSGVSTLTEETEVTISVTSHVHVITNKGECADENCDYELTDYRKDLDEMVGETEGQMLNGKHYYKATMEAGKTYKLSFTADGITYVLYGGENADVVMTVTDGAFVCTESGEYYYVITVAQNTAQQDKIIYTVEETPVVEG